MFSAAFSSPTPTPTSQEAVDNLREDATQTAMDIITGVQENFLPIDQFQEFQNRTLERFNDISRINTNIMRLISVISDRLNLGEVMVPDEEEDAPVTPRAEPQERFTTPRPAAEPDNASLSTHYDLDHDVIMRSRFAYTVNQVPEPGFFTGDTTQTDLFCQLCEDTFKTYPNRFWPEDAKVNFVQSRLRDSARNWFLTKYPNNIMPATMQELLQGLRKAFSNVSSYKLAKIKLVNLKQTYGKINDYIEEFRSFTRQFNWDEESLTLFFYNGLHSKYQEEIDKIEVFPTTLESIITSCILFESSLTTKNKIKQTNNGRNNKNKNSNQRYKQNYKNRNYNNKNNFNKNFNNNNNNQNNDGNYISKVQKVTSKN